MGAEVEALREKRMIMAERVRDVKLVIIKERRT